MRVKPIPLQVIQLAITHCQFTTMPLANTIAHMLIFVFFFLLHPGEYAYTNNPNAAPFHLCDVHLNLHNRRLNPLICSEQDLHAATYVGLEFTTQKNGVRGETVGLGWSGHPTLCPVLALIQHLLHLHAHRAPLTTPLYAYHNIGTWHIITTTTLTQHLRWAASTLAQTTGISPHNISIRSLCSSGAMALLCADVDSDKIHLLDRWHSNEMMRYLHVQVFPTPAPLAPLMVHHGYFTLIPNNPLG
jgi:hypothetical protein